MLLAAAWVGIRGALAVQHLAAAQSTAEELVTALRTDNALDGGTARNLSQDTAAARDLTSDPIWGAAVALPWIGAQLDAVRAIAESADIAASEALPPLVARGSVDVDSLVPVNGQFDLTMIASLQEPLAHTSSALARSAAAVDHVETSVLLRPLSARLGTFRALIDDAAAGADALHRAVELLPGMLGADGPRTYLLLFQNNAEWRSLGGIPGQVAHVTASEGQVTLDGLVAAGNFPQYPESVLPLADDVEAVYGDRPGQWMQDVTQVPDFAVSAQLAREMWSREFGETVDGVFAVDTVTLSYLLKATGPISLPGDDTINAENALSQLLNEVYFRYPDPADQDAFFEATAGAVFSALTAGAPDPAQLLDALARAGAERRLLAWSADESEQTRISGTALAGALPATSAKQASFGVFLNDGTGSKMDYYAAAEAAVDWLQCGGDLNDARLEVTLSSVAPSADSLPKYISGGGVFGVPAGITRTVIYVYLPEGYELIDSDLPDDLVTSGGYHDGRHVVTLIVDQQPGQPTTMSLTARGPAASVVTALITPSVNAIETVTGAGRC
jgi:hypothetical protein